MSRTTRRLRTCLAVGLRALVVVVVGTVATLVLATLTRDEPTSSTAASDPAASDRDGLRPAGPDLALEDGVVVVGEDHGPLGSSVVPPELCAPGRARVTYGTAGADVLTGTAGADVICGRGGNDVIRGRGGKDVIVGGAGDDSIFGGSGDDEIWGGAGTDAIGGEGGDDFILAGDGPDAVRGHGGVDFLVGEAGDDTLYGGEGADELNGGDDVDDLDGGNGPDYLAGGYGDDTIAGRSGDDRIFGDDGTDIADGADGTDLCDAETTRLCERDLRDVSPFAKPFPIEEPVAGPRSITVDNLFEGVVIEMETNGGIWPWDVELAPAREHMGGPLADQMPGGAWYITVPEDAPAIEYGSLTLPYNPDRLDGFAEADLRIFYFNPDTRQWEPAADVADQTVDADANTVTTPVTHFSVFAVLAITPD